MLNRISECQRDDIGDYDQIQYHHENTLKSLSHYVILSVEHGWKKFRERVHGEVQLLKWYQKSLVINFINSAMCAMKSFHMKTRRPAVGTITKYLNCLSLG